MSPVSLPVRARVHRLIVIGCVPYKYFLSGDSSDTGDSFEFKGVFVSPVRHQCHQINERGEDDDS